MRTLKESIMDDEEELEKKLGDVWTLIKEAIINDECSDSTLDYIQDFLIKKKVIRKVDLVEFEDSSTGEDEHAWVDLCLFDDEEQLSPSYPDLSFSLNKREDRLYLMDNSKLGEAKKPEIYKALSKLGWKLDSSKDMYIKL